MKKVIHTYLHSDKDTNSDLAREMGMGEDESSRFRYDLHEVEFTLEVDLETGNYRILRVDGKELKE
jgi:hypothetical protein